MITKEQLSKIVSIADQNKLIELTNNLNDTLQKYQINNPLRISHFLAQVLHESANLTAVKENLNYNKEGLLKVFGKYFNPVTALAYERKPEKIANKVYANRMGNGNEASGDGWKYRGQGYLQTTGKSNFLMLSKEFGVDFIMNPELLQTPQYAFLSAGSFWNRNNLNVWADKNNLDRISDLINLGRATDKIGDANGYIDRKDKFNKIYNLLK